MCKRKFSNKVASPAAFTLIEMSMVIIVVGLLVSGVVIAKDIIKHAESRTAIHQVNKYLVAINNFKMHYDALPGDFREAEQYWPGETFNGNGNNQVHANPINGKNEPILFWKHLNLAGLISNSYTGVPEGPFGLVTGVNIPMGTIESTAWNVIYTANISLGGGAPDPGDPSSFFSSPTDGIYGRINNVLELSSDNTGPLKGAAVRPSDAYMIDRKIDDGISVTGNVFGTNATVSGASGCVGGTDLSGYLLTNNTVVCAMYFWLD